MDIFKKPGVLISHPFTLLIGCIFLFTGLYYYGFTTGLSQCDPNQPIPVNNVQSQYGVAGTIIGSILVGINILSKLAA
jgi:hypothetical protein